MNDMFFDEHRATAPPAADAHALARVAEAARARASRSRTTFGTWAVGDVRLTDTTKRAVQIAATFAATAAVIATAVWAWSPHVDDSAFARQQAMAALKPQAGVLHANGTLSVRSWNESDDEWQDFMLRSEEWVDIDAGQTRNVGRDPKTGAMSELTIRSGSTVRSLGRDAAPDPATGELTAPGTWRVVQYEDRSPVSSPGGAWIDMLHSGLDSGEAEVIDRIVEDGKEFWVLEMVLLEKAPETGSCKTTVHATIREGSYQLRVLELVRETKHPVDGEGKEIVRLAFSTWESVDRSSLPADFFDLGQVDASAPRGAIIEKPLGD